MNELSPPASSSITFAFSASKDIFGKDDCPNSNGAATVGAEIIYALVPDPTGAVNSNVRTVSTVRGATVRETGHELQHLVNGFRRVYVTGASFFETGWLNEALSNAAEELMFFKTSGMSTKVNITTGTNATSGIQLNSRRVAAYNAYESGLFGRFRGWLQRPDTVGLVSTLADKSLARQGFGGAFLRYATDRRNTNDPAFFSALVNSNLEGLPNLQNAIGGAAPYDWMRDFEIALYVDDVAGITPVSQYTTPSWNYRAFYALLYGSYSLFARPLSNNVALSLSYARGGSTSYVRFGVPASGFAKLTSTPGGDVNQFRFSWIRTK